MKLILLAGVAVSALTMATAAAAEQPAGPYWGADLGFNWRSDQKVTSDNVTGPNLTNKYAYNLSTKDTAAGFLKLGYRFNQQWRAELEGAYRPGDVNKAVGPRTYFPGDNTAVKAPDSAIVNGSNTAFSSPSGHINQTSLMVNLLRDFASDYRFHPYVGVGVGIDSVNGTVKGAVSRTGQAISLNGSKVVPAVQGIVGFAYALSPRMSLDFGYRLMAVSKVTYGSTLTGPSLMGNGAPGNFKGNFTNQTVSVGLRYTLGTVAEAPPPAPAYTPPPAPAPTPAPPPPVAAPAAPPPVATAPVAASRQFVVYFRFNRSSLTKDAQAVIHAAADYAAGKASKVVVVGYTDTSGSRAYNMKLSERRARSTAKELVIDGVPKSIMSLDWKGEDNLAVPTADGTKEPANRRSTIDVVF